ncbi:MAG: glycerol-3-phosphate acyltransferase [Rubrobacteraceae bacterium]
MFETLTAAAAGYLIGSVPLGLIVSKAVAGVDIRRHGTGNMGAANVRENAGVFAGLLVALGVFLQGLAPALVLRLAGGAETAVAGVAVGAVVGYGWPVFLGFKGGRAVGTGTGAATALYPLGFFSLVLTYALGALVRRTSLGLLLGFVVYSGFVFYAADSTAYRVASILILLVIAARRLEGVVEETKKGPPVKTFLNLLLFQKRP